MCGAEDDSTLLREVEVGDRSQMGPRGYKNRRGPGPESVLGQSEGPLETGVGFLEASFELVPDRIAKILTEMSGKEIQVRANNVRAHSNLVRQARACFCILSKNLL